MGPKRKKASSRAAAKVDPQVNGDDHSDQNGSAGQNGVAVNGDSSAEEEKFIAVPSKMKLIWQLKDKKDWCTFSPEVCEALTSAAVHGIHEVGLESGPKTKMTANLLSMVQETSTAQKNIRCLFESGDGYEYWGIKDSDKCLQPGIVAKLIQIGDISSEAKVEGWKYHLENMTRQRGDVTEAMIKEQVVPGKFKKSGAAGKIVASKTDDKDGPTPAKKSKVEKSSKKSKTAVKKEEVDEEEEEKPVMKSIVRKGLAPVDPECPQKEKYHVFTEGKDIWDTMLNQTNIQNNNNKYFLIQLLESDGGGRYGVWMRWGRVGYSGQNKWHECGGSLDSAKSIFTKKFQDKTVNAWDARDSFEKRAGKYDLVLMDYNAGKEEEDEVDSKVKSKADKETKPKEIPESSLEKQVQDLISLICDIRTMEQSVVEMEYDTKKAPLGKITTEQIKAGYQALKDISDCINSGRTSGGAITQACNDFYTRIPHEFGFRVPPLIKTAAEVKKKLELLEALSDIQVALKMLSGEDDDTVNPIDRRYKQLQVDIKSLEKDDDERKAVENSIHCTHASTHQSYTMEVLDVFKLQKDNETDKFNDVGNNRLLYHGSRLSNWAGILGQGLRIAPPEAPVTGYMFGKGVYFADMSSKSANYCFTNRTNNIGLLMLCEVSLGNPNKLVNANYNADKLPKGCHSVLGQGKTQPGELVTLESGLQIPAGKPRKTSVENKQGYTLQYNEYIVYNTNQIKMKYLAKIKFNHKY